MRFMLRMTGSSLLILLCIGPAMEAATIPEWAKGEIKPSENKGRKGRYHSKTRHPGYNYFVYVPESYSEDNPAGIHIFFHGQGSQGSARSFGKWAEYFLEKYNLIGINMEYTDGDNARDTAGKVDAAEEAIAQVLADYKIIEGRGVIASFSGGGLIHKGLFIRYAGKKGGQRAHWPFNHSALYSSNFWTPADNHISMSWFIALGEKEWNMGRPTLGKTQVARASELLQDAMKGACPDIHLKVIKGKPHTITDEDVKSSSEQFRRSDLAFAPFIYVSDYPERELRPIVAAANVLMLGKAHSMLKRLLRKRNMPPDVRQKAGILDTKIEARVDADIALVKELASTDPVLCNYYGSLFLSQLTQHPKKKTLRKILAKVSVSAGFRRALAAFRLFAAEVPSIFSGPKVVPAKVPMLQQILQVSGPESLTGKMCSEFLSLNQ